MNAVQDSDELPLLVNVKLCETAGAPTFSVPKLNEVGVIAPLAPKAKLQTCNVTGAEAGSRFQNPRLVAEARNARFVAIVEVMLFCVTCRLAVSAVVLTDQVNTAGVPTIHDTEAV